MRKLSAIILGFFFMALSVQAQEEYLVIKYKDGTSEKVSLKSIKGFSVTNTTGPSECRETEEIKLLKNVPNPVTDNTTFYFNTDEPGDVQITILDINGRVVRSLLIEGCAAGQNTAVWNCTSDDGAKVSSGFYFFEINSGSSKQHGKLLVID